MGMSKGLLDISPQEFVRFLHDQRISKFFFIYDPDHNRLFSSHSELQSVADFIEADRRDFDRHEGLFFQISRPTDTLQGAFVHRTNRGQASGGVRYWHYDSVEEYLRDGLRLSKAMTQKIALAGLWWGGGKGVMVQNPDMDCSNPDMRASVYRSFGDLLTSLRGCYVAAEDVGTNVADMANIYSRTRFTTCIPQELGGSGNPSILTAKGVICGMDAGLAITGDGTMKGKSVAVQGMGNVGGPLIGFLFERGVKRVIANDINPDLVQRLKREFAGRELEASVVERGDMSILGAECDILSPCATGAILNPDTIPQLKAKIICGGANNQLEDAERDGLLLHRRNVTFVPDFIANRMGIVNCANEQYGYVNNDDYIQRHLGKEWEHSIYQISLRVLRTSLETGEPSARIAMRLADNLPLENHPIFGHRGRRIIDSLLEDRWHRS